MDKNGLDRRTFLKGAAGGAAVATVATAATTAALPAQAQSARPAQAPPPASAGYAYLNTDEAAFIEAVVDHMVPADAHSPKGTDLGLNTYIDRALAGGWGKGDRLYLQGPWKTGTPSQGYQLPLTPAELYRAGIAAANAACLKAYGRGFDKIAPAQREEFLLGLQGGKVVFEAGPPAQVFFTTLYQNVMEGMFADPIYGGNRQKAGWKMLGFPGVIAVHRQDVERYRGKKFPADPLGIADMS